jgi:hypothetical protein
VEQQGQCKHLESVEDTTRQGCSNSVSHKETADTTTNFLRHFPVVRTCTFPHVPSPGLLCAMLVLVHIALMKYGKLITLSHLTVIFSICSLVSSVNKLYSCILSKYLSYLLSVYLYYLIYKFIPSTGLHLKFVS